MRLIRFARHHQAEARELGRGEPLAPVLGAPLVGERVHRRDVAVRNVLHALGRRCEVGHRPDQADGRIGPEQPHELVGPAVGHDRVVIEEYQVLTAHHGQAGITGGRKSPRLRVADDVHRQPAHYRPHRWRRPPVPSVDPSSTRINSQGAEVCRTRACTHSRVNSSCPRHGTMTETKPDWNGRHGRSISAKIQPKHMLTLYTSFLLAPDEGTRHVGEHAL